jgi:predicted phosphate transport protein (TIGR00153 family)
MLGSLLPREGKFFELFNRHGELISAGGKVLMELFAQFDNTEVRGRNSERIDEIEKAADHYTHEVVALLHQTFVTPFDREQIHTMISRMDDVLDLAQDVAQSLMLYDIQRVSLEAQQLAELASMCCERVAIIAKLLDNMDNAQTIIKVCGEIDKLESDADRVMRSAVSKLFRNEVDVRELIKQRAIFELLEAITDKCEDVANTIEGIVLEQA